MPRTAYHTIRPFPAAKSFWGWAIALVGSIALNITLFGLMPGLIQRIPAPPDELEELKHIQVIRVKKADPPPRKKEPRKMTRPKPVQPVKQARQVRVKQKKIALKPQLKFELNSRLPAAPMDLVMPSLENFAMDVPVMKDAYDIAELDTGLTALVRIPPIYPIRAKRRGIQGFVTVEFLVSGKGLVQEVAIIRAEPESVFDNAVINCVSRWKFTPPTVEGIPVAARARTTIRFHLEEDG